MGKWVERAKPGNRIIDQHDLFMNFASQVNYHTECFKCGESCSALFLRNRAVAIWWSGNTTHFHTASDLKSKYVAHLCGALLGNKRGKNHNRLLGIFHIK